MAETRTYLVVAYDVTDLSEDEADGLSGEAIVQAEESEFHPSVDEPAEARVASASADLLLVLSAAQAEALNALVGDALDQAHEAPGGDHFDHLGIDGMEERLESLLPQLGRG